VQGVGRRIWGHHLSASRREPTPSGTMFLTHPTYLHRGNSHKARHTTFGKLGSARNEWRNRASEWAGITKGKRQRKRSDSHPHALHMPSRPSYACAVRLARGTRLSPGLVGHVYPVVPILGILNEFIKLGHPLRLSLFPVLFDLGFGLGLRARPRARTRDPGHGCGRRRGPAGFASPPVELAGGGSRRCSWKSGCWCWCWSSSSCSSRATLPSIQLRRTSDIPLFSCYSSFCCESGCLWRSRGGGGRHSGRMLVRRGGALGLGEPLAELAPSSI
jgi:hypothetical protein